MLNPKNLSVIIKYILRGMKLKDSYMAETLIKGTFLHRSGLTELFDYSDSRNPLHGLMLLSHRELTDLYDRIRLNIGMKDNIATATGIDITDMSKSAFMDELDYNIGFMVAICYAFYALAKEEIPEDGVEAAAAFYRRNLLKTDDTTVDNEFVHLYRQIFCRLE